MVSTGAAQPPTVQPLPSGGTAGQVLTRTASGTAWQQPSAEAAMARPAGSLFDNRAVLSTTSQVTLSSSGTYYVPIWLPVSVAVTGAKAMIGTAIGGTLTVSLHTCDPITARPAAMLGVGSPVTPAASQTLIGVTVTAVNLRANWYYVGIGFAYSGSSCQLISTAATQTYSPIGFQPDGPATTGGVQLGWVDTANTVPVANPTVTGNVAANGVPLVWITT